MAQDYSINLKATLDTTQVKQLLALLNAQQKKALTETAAGGTAKAGFPNLQNLQSVLSRLSVSLNQFLNTMRQLTAVLRSQNSAIRSAARPQVINTGSRSGGNSIYAGLASDIKYLNQQKINLKKQQEEYKAKIRANVSNAAKILKDSGVNVPFFEGKGGSKKQADWMRNYVRLFDDAWLLENGLGNDNALKQVAMARRAGSRLNAADKILKDLDKAYWKYGLFHGAWNAAKFNAKMNKRFGMLIGGQILGGASDIATSLGYDTLGTGLNVAGLGITAGAGTAFMMSQLGMAKAGPVGALVGGITAVTTGFAKLKERTEALGQTLQAISLKNQTLISNFRSSLNANEIAWKSAKTQDFYNALPLDILKRRRNSMYGSYLENLDKRDTTEKYYRELLSRIEANRDAQLKPLYSRSTLLAANNSIYGAGSKILEQNNIAELIKLIQESATTQIEAAKNAYENEIKDITQNINDYENLLKAIDNVSNKEKERIKLQEQEALRLTELKTAHEAYLKSLSESISKFKGEFTLAAAEQNATIFTQDILANKQMSARDKFRAISERLDAAYDSRNSALSTVYSSVNELDRFAKSFYMTADVGNLPFAGFMRQSAVQKLSKNIADSLLDLANLNSLVNIFENALKSITLNLTAPDMSHITSISQYGYGMGETDNAEQRMENYLSKQTNLLEQINEKLRQGIKTLPLYAD